MRSLPAGLPFAGQTSETRRVIYLGLSRSDPPAPFQANVELTFDQRLAWHQKRLQDIMMHRVRHRILRHPLSDETAEDDGSSDEDDEKTKGTRQPGSCQRGSRAQSLSATGERIRGCGINYYLNENVPPDLLG